MESKRITLSKDALSMIEHFRKVASFRSRSETIEEIIRRVYYVQKSRTVEAANIQFKRLGFTLGGEIK